MGRVVNEIGVFEQIMVFEIPGTWSSGNLETWSSGNLRTWNSGNLETSELKFPELGNFGTWELTLGCPIINYYYVRTPESEFPELQVPKFSSFRNFKFPSSQNFKFPNFLFLKFK